MVCLYDILRVQPIERHCMDIAEQMHLTSYREGDKDVLLGAGWSAHRNCTACVDRRGDLRGT